MKKNQISKQVNNLSEEEAKEMLSNLIETTFTVVQWPDSQNLMEARWFRKEAVLEVEAKFGSSAYFVPTFRIL